MYVRSVEAIKYNEFIRLHCRECSVWDHTDELVVFANISTFVSVGLWSVHYIETTFQSCPCTKHDILFNVGFVVDIIRNFTVSFQRRSHLKSIYFDFCYTYLGRRHTCVVSSRSAHIPPDDDGTVIKVRWYLPTSGRDVVPLRSALML